MKKAPRLNGTIVWEKAGEDEYTAIKVFRCGRFYPYTRQAPPPTCNIKDVTL